MSFESQFYDEQTIVMTRSKASEAVSRVLMDDEKMFKHSAIELARKILRSLGFK